MTSIILSVSIQESQRYRELPYTKEITEVEHIQQIQLNLGNRKYGFSGTDASFQTSVKLSTFQILWLKKSELLLHLRDVSKMGRTGKLIYLTLFIHIFYMVTPNASLSHISNFHHVTYLWWSLNKQHYIAPFTIYSSSTYLMGEKMIFDLYLFVWIQIFSVLKCNRLCFIPVRAPLMHRPSDPSA